MRACAMMIYMKTDGWRSSESANHDEPAEPSKRITNGRAGDAADPSRGQCEDVGGSVGHALMDSKVRSLLACPTLRALISTPR